MNFDLSSVNRDEMLEKLLMIKGLYRNGFIQLIKSTRHYELGLELSNLFENILEENKDLLAPQQIENIELLIIQTRLTCLDCLDRWNAFIHYYNQILSEKHDSLTFHSFLQVQSNRFEVIKRKIDKVTKSEKLGNSFHKPQSDLSDSQIELRTSQIIQWIKLLDNSLVK
ncbi:hypothetical protein WKH57_15455 [Niallia taxi]|uniref:hypothetical protein n=1 Tax=Niallia taxi TaxID=2499688 RepID=UPI00317D93A4